MCTHHVLVLVLLFLLLFFLSSSSGSRCVLASDWSSGNGECLGVGKVLLDLSNM